jgi:very-short-patch-repair endonuclease
VATATVFETFTYQVIYFLPSAFYAVTSDVKLYGVVSQQGGSSMAIDWSKVLKNHIEWACSRYDAGENRPTHPARNTFLIFNGKPYPAKFIRGLAYEIATGAKLSSDDYSGGAETAQFFRALGFSVEYNGKPLMGYVNMKQTRSPQTETMTQPPKKENSSSGKMQKDFLIKLLKQRFGRVITEAKFDWLKVPDRVSEDSVLDGLYENLALSRDHYNFSTPGYKLACDFFIPSENLIIEYDERQHFTEQRAKSLAHYPPDLNLSFDKDKWCEACKNTKATDNDPIYRDEQRAFYDSVRDILAARNGMTLIRINDGDYDWESESGVGTMDNLVNCPKAKARPLNIDEIDAKDTIEQIACDLAKCQEAYHRWARGFESHEKVIDWLKSKNMGECPEQEKFDLRSSHWNSITIPLLHKLVPDCMARMKDQFDKLFQNLPEDSIDSDLIWYLLYFLHPGRHELYYFDLHYNRYEYSAHLRLAKFVRSHRLGLKGAKTYLINEEDRKIDDPHIKACGTMAFKHLHLHPTTSKWEKPDPRNISEKYICDLEIVDGGPLSSDEKKVAIALSTRATPSFGRWINYAPCAINEGPICTLKEGKKHSDCCKEMIEILQGTNQNQSAMRAKLEGYYEIKVTSELDKLQFDRE